LLGFSISTQGNLIDYLTQFGGLGGFLKQMESEKQANLSA